MSTAYLVLSSGQIYEGTAIGCWPEKDRAAAASFGLGELVFTTGMVGYLETLTDPSYAGQIILQGFPLIGNYGVIPEDFEGKPHCKGYVVRELCEYPSNFRSEYALDRFLKDQQIPGICGIDTRQIVRTIREEGVMNACLVSELPEDLDQLLKQIRAYEVTGVVREASENEIQVFPADQKTAKVSPADSGTEPAHFKVALMDYGAKHNIIRSLTKRGCEVTLYPADTPAETVLSGSPDGIMLSNGPGDPAENTFEIQQIRKMIGKKPIFGICLGHQLTALAMGLSTYKLHYGHRGANQPVRRLKDGRCFITSQNHGYAVERPKAASAAKGAFGEQAPSLSAAVISYENANDGSIEGMEYPGLDCFTVQFHPEACGGPHDTEFLFDEFVRLMNKTKSGATAKTDAGMNLAEPEENHA